MERDLLSDIKEEYIPHIHAEWLDNAATKSCLWNIGLRAQEHMQHAMNLAETKDVTKEQLLVQLTKAKTLNDLIKYVKEIPQSIVVVKS